ncbi:unnamed protein product [Somion occarium]|uniref:HAM1-like N-terminal domain-containing protein n=1 Tax=Somion occarium TaxID=3059160 RepID=A0ABP1DH22_9APHY
MNLFCCCRRRRSPENDPLLPKHGVRSALHRPSQSQLNKITEVFGALQAGKYPSQTQLNDALRALLSSELLAHSDRSRLSETSKELLLDIRGFIQVLIQIGMEKNDDDKIQDFMYRLKHIESEALHADVVVDVSTTTSQPEVETTARTLPSEEEAKNDGRILLNSLFTLLRLLITASVFRFMLLDILKVVREVLADTAADVGQIAQQVEVAAELAEETIRPDAEGCPSLDNVTNEDFENALEGAGRDARGATATAASQGPEQVKAAAMIRIQKAIAQAHTNSTYRSALRNLHTLFRKYASKVTILLNTAQDAATASKSSTPPTLTPIIWSDDPNVAQALSDLDTLLTRFASGRSPVALTDALYQVIWDVTNIPTEVASLSSGEQDQIRVFLQELGAWLDRALCDSKYVTSTTGKEQLENLYDRARGFVRSKSALDVKIVRDIRSLVDETDSFLTALCSDPSTLKLIQSLDRVGTSLPGFFASLANTAVSQGLQLASVSRQKAVQVRDELLRDVLTWFLPRLLAMVKVLPMPRLEYRDQTIDAAIDALLLTSSAGTSLLPDHVRVHSYNEIALDYTECTPPSSADLAPPESVLHLPEAVQSNLSTCTRMRVHLDGIRVAAWDIGYYVRYKGPLRLGYEDEGLVNAELGDIGKRGSRGSGGISVDVELEIQTEPTKSVYGGPLFEVKDIRVDIPRLSFSLSHTKHPIINTLIMKPLASSLGRPVARYYLTHQLRNALEGLSRLAAEFLEMSNRLASDRSTAPSDPTLDDYWTALLRVVNASWSHSDVSNGGAGDVRDNAAPETYSKITAKGVIRTTVHPSDSSGEQTSTLAVGVGAQILPGKGGPHDSKDYEYAPKDMAREALDEIQDAVDKGSKQVQELGRSVTEVRQKGMQLHHGLQNATVREHDRQESGISQQGWRSSAFD